MRFISKVIAVCLGFTALAATAEESTRVINGVVAKVDDKIITYVDLDRQLSRLLENLRKDQYRYTPAALQQRIATLRSNAVEQLIQRHLILKAFSTSGYKLPETFLQDQVKERIREVYGDQITLTKTLQAQGVTKESFRQQVKDDIIVEFMQHKHISSELIVSPQKMANYYEQHQDQFKVGDQVKLRMIILDKANHADGSARRLADEILAKLKEGAPFAELADLYSEAKRKSPGGDRGWVERSDSDLRKELAEVAFALEPGKQSDVIETSDSCFLLQTDERKAAHVRPLSEVRDEIEKVLRLEQRARLQSTWIDKLKNTAYIAYFGEPQSP